MKSMRSARPVITRKAAAAAVIAAAAVLSLAACSSGGTAAPTASTSGGPVTPVKLTLAMAAPSAGQPCVFYAIESGIYKELGLDLTISPQGSNEPALAAAGNFVIGANTITQAYPAMQAGRQISQVLAQTVGNPSDAVTVKVGSPYKTLMDLSGATVGVVGTSGYSFAGGTLYSRYIVSQGGKALNLVVQPDQNTLTANLVNGKIAAAVFPPVFGPQISQGILKQILSAKSALSTKLNGGTSQINSTFWGLSSTIKQNATAVTRLVAGCRIADQLMSKETSKQIAAVLAKNANFAPSVIPTDQLITQVEESYIGFEPPNQGKITSTQWDTTLKSWIKIGINPGTPYKVGAPGFSYKEGVDMSYWNDATTSVNAYLAKHSK
ncbi:MAG TPA: ABC transporter substrate-binding protein [Pseudolysinimonas sp.]|jgi:ABC-type nitrate/sulfonate/bicarbonate transport system substrate-binding protein